MMRTMYLTVKPLEFLCALGVVIAFTYGMLEQFSVNAEKLIDRREDFFNTCMSIDATGIESIWLGHCIGLVNTIYPRNHP